MCVCVCACVCVCVCVYVCVCMCVCVCVCHPQHTGVGLARIINIRRVGQNRIYVPYMTVYMVISLPKIPYMHRIYMVLANPKYTGIYGTFGREITRHTVMHGAYIRHTVQANLTQVQMGRNNGAEGQKQQICFEEDCGVCATTEAHKTCQSTMTV